MEKSEKLQELIDKQLLGKLHPAEAEALEAAKQQDPSLAANIAASEQAIAAIDVYNDQQLKARLQALEQQLRSQAAADEDRSSATPAPPAAPFRVLRSRQWLAVAASLLLLLAAAWWWTQLPTAEPLGPATFAANFSPHRNLAVNITRAGDGNTPEEAAYAAYEAAQWDEAAMAIAALPPSLLHDFYLAQIELQQQATEKAIQRLEKLVASDFPLREEAEWYLALAFMQQNQGEKARPWLERIAAAPEHPFREEASSLMDD